MFLFLFDPVMLFSILIAYVLGMLVMFVAAQSIAPRVAKRVSGKLSLRASMALLGLIIVVGGLAGVLVLLAILGWLTNPYAVSGAALYVLIVILLMNGVIYLISPWIINLSYGARHDPELQRMVNEIAKRSGLSKPPKAVVVNGPPNAFAYGNFLAGRWVAVSSEMLRIARKDELEAVIGHELGHHRHGDNAVMLFMGLIPSFLYYLGLVLVQSSFYYSAMSSENRRGGGGIFFMLTGGSGDSPELRDPDTGAGLQQAQGVLRRRSRGLCDEPNLDAEGPGQAPRLLQVQRVGRQRGRPEQAEGALHIRLHRGRRQPVLQAHTQPKRRQGRGH